MADRYFTYDPEGDGFETHPTAASAEAHARAILDEERSDAWDGWNEDRVATLCWGAIRGRVVETSRKEVPPGVTLDEDDQGSDGEDYSDIPHGCDALVYYEIRAIEAEEEVPRLRAALAEAERAAFVEATGAANDLSERGAHQEQAAGSILRQIQAIRLRVDPVYAASLEGRCAREALDHCPEADDDAEPAGDTEKEAT